MTRDPLCLGIDPGIGTCGWARVRRRGDRLLSEGYGVIRTRPEDPLPVRLRELHDRMEELRLGEGVDCAAVERLFFGKNRTTAEMVFQARGVALLYTAGLRVPLFEPKPAEVKLSICGSGVAEKGRIAKMVQLLLGLPELPSPDDAADALALGIVGLSLLSAPQSRLLSRPKAEEP